MLSFDRDVMVALVDGELVELASDAPEVGQFHEFYRGDHVHAAHAGVAADASAEEKLHVATRLVAGLADALGDAVASRAASLTSYRPSDLPNALRIEVEMVALRESVPV